MKLKISTAATLFGFLLLMPLAHGQTSQSIQGNVPFSFHVGNTVLPAGQYVIGATSSGSATLRIQNSGPKGKTIMCLTNSVQANSAQNAKMVFHRYGSTYFLSQIWSGSGQNTGSGLGPSKAERAMAHEMAAAGRPHNMELASVAFTVR
jgi:hypothetical protein